MGGGNRFWRALSGVADAGGYEGKGHGLTRMNRDLGDWAGGSRVWRALWGVADAGGYEGKGHGLTRMNTDFWRVDRRVGGAAQAAFSRGNGRAILLYRGRWAGVS